MLLPIRSAHSQELVVSRGRWPLSSRLRWQAAHLRTLVAS
jgi:hypothetical protein